MPTYQVISIIDNQPTFEKPIEDILSKCKAGGAIKILDPIEYHTEQQRKWYKGVCLKGLSDWNGETIDEWDFRLKTLCGSNLLKTDTWKFQNVVTVNRLTIVGVGKKNLTQFIENILSLAITEDWPVTAPNKELTR